MNLPSITLAIRRNKSKLAFVVLFIAVTVFLIVSTLSLTQYVSKADLRAWGAILRNVTILTPTVDQIVEQTLAELEDGPNREVVLPFFDNSIRMPGILASEYRPVISLRTSDIEIFLETLGSQLIMGDLPRSGSRDIVISKDIFDARGLEVGDHIGNAIDDREILWGRFTVSGVLDTNASLGITSYEYYKSRGITGSSLFLLSPYNTTTTNQLLWSHKGQFKVENYETFLERYYEEYGNFERLMVIISVILVVSSLVISIIFTYLYLSGRKQEFGLFLSRGINTQRIALFVIAELAIVAFVSWILGLILSWVTLWFIRTVMFEKGIISATVNLQSVCFTVPMIVLFVLFSGILVLYMVSRDRLEAAMIGG